MHDIEGGVMPIAIIMLIDNVLSVLAQRKRRGFYDSAQLMNMLWWPSYLLGIPALCLDGVFYVS